MRLIYCGTPDFSVSALNALSEAGHEIVLTVTQPDKPKGRSGKLQPSPVKEAALKLGLPVFQPERLRDEGIFEKFSELAPDAIIVVAFGQIVPKNILDLPKYGCINVHASLLPAYRGAAPIQWAILDGHEKTGVSIMQMNEGLDTGDILSVCEVPIADDETGGSLFNKLADEGANLLIKTLNDIETGNISPVPQPAESTTPYARMIKKTDGLIDWNDPAEKIDRQIRGLYPWPGAYTAFAGKTLKVIKASVCEEESSCLSGEIVSLDKKGFKVKTGTGVLNIEMLQLEGKKPMDAKSFVNGVKEVPAKLG